MKRTLATLAAVLALVASAWAENGYRAHYYSPSVLEQETGKPFVFHTICIADSEAEVRAYIYGESPDAVILGIDYLGVAEETTDTSYDANDPNSNAADVPAEPKATPAPAVPIAEGVDYSQEPGLPVEWKRPGQPSKKNRPESRKRAILGP